MKTTNIDQETENKKIENPVSKTFAVVLSLVLISFTVSANGFWKQLLVNNTFGKMAILMVDQENENTRFLTYASPVASSTDARSSIDAFVIKSAPENNLKIESWMTKEALFGANALTDQACKEQPLKIENWMMDNSSFAVPVISTEKEPALKLEAWMMDENRWTN